MFISMSTESIPAATEAVKRGYVQNWCSDPSLLAHCKRMQKVCKKNYGDNIMELLTAHIYIYIYNMYSWICRYIDM